LINVLHSSGWLPTDSSVHSVVEEQAGGGGGLGKASRLVITYRDHEEHALSLILKQANEIMPRSIALLAHEVRAYGSDIFTKAGLTVPRHVAITEGPLAPALLLEDLGDSGFTRFRVGCTEQDALAMMEAAAALHAEHWEYPRERYEWVPDVIDSDITKYCIDSLARFSSWPPSLRQHATFVACHAEMIAARLTDGHTTITHGDFHCLNLSLRNTDGVVGVTIVDLQLIQRATPMLDVARFIGTSLQSRVRGQIDGKTSRTLLRQIAGSR
jgi:aminoglycoside/choline kinase family phosphotransferase